MGLRGSFPAMPREERRHRVHADPNNITRFHMVGKEKFLGPYIMRSTGRQKAGKVLDAKNRMCTEKKPLTSLFMHPDPKKIKIH